MESEVQSRFCGHLDLDWAIIEGGLEIPERAALHRDAPEHFTPDPDRAAEVLHRWRNMLGRSEGASLDDRLADLGIREADFATVVGSVAESAAGSLPREPWMNIAAAVADWRGPCDESGLPLAAFLTSDEDTSIPFEHGLVPWVDVATERLRARRPDVEEVLGPELLQRQQRRLAAGLALFARDLNIVDLDRHRFGRYSGNDFAIGLFSTSPPRDAYIATVREMIGPHAEAWMRRVPALARLLATRADAWARGLAEFVDRLETDGAIIRDEFAGGVDPGALTEVSFGSGDSHNGGRTVAMLRFESGLRLVYKPRSCSVDVAFRSIVDAVNEPLGPELHLRVPHTIDRGIYGWAEFIDATPCRDADAIGRFYRRMGVLLAIIHTLQGNDFHLENVKADGEDPVPIDLETVSVPSGLIEDPNTTPDAAVKSIEHSVLRTLLLPNAMGFGHDRQLRNMGAIQLEAATGQQRVVRRLLHVNTDFQRWITDASDGVDETINSQVRAENGDTIANQSQQAAIRSGYDSAYRSILERAAHWSSGESPVGELGAAWVRVLNRATNVYMRLLLESCESSNLTSGVDRWIALDRLALCMESGVDLGRPTAVELVAAEHSALFAGDVAYFLATGAGRTYWVVDSESGRQTELPNAALSSSAVESARSQIGRMGVEDLAMQLKLQGDAYQTTVASLDRILHVRPSDPGPDDVEALVSQRPLRELVVEALEVIVDQAVSTGENKNWIDLTLDPQSEALRPSPLDADVYSGRGGLSLLFERAYRVLGDRRWLDLARSALGHEFAIWQQVATREQFLRGAPSGLLQRAGLMAGFWAIGRHEGFGGHRVAARELATSISDRTIRNDQSFDVIAGSAGYILLLLRLAEEEELPGVHEVVGRLADHLVATHVDDGGPGWQTLGGDSLPLCGFGHGRAGIGLALLEAGRALDRPDLRRFAMSVFEAEHGWRGATPAEGWPDYRSLKPSERSKAPMGANRWCAGTEGIALSRAAALAVVDDPLLRDDLDFAMETVRPSTVPGRVHLCCGLTGRILTHQTLDRLLDEPGLFDRKRSMEIVAGSLDPRVTPEPSVMGVGLFQGTGGLIWTALSLLDDDGSDLLLLRP